LAHLVDRRVISDAKNPVDWVPDINVVDGRINFPSNSNITYYSMVGLVTLSMLSEHEFADSRRKIVGGCVNAALN